MKSLEKTALLEKWFEENGEKKTAKYEKQQLANHTNMSLCQINVWIKRAKRRKRNSNCKKIKRKNLSASVQIILNEHLIFFKYPTDDDISHLQDLTDLSKKQIKNWFKRERFIQKKAKVNVL